MDTKLDEFKEAEQASFDKICENLMITKFARYEQVWAEFSNFFDQENLVSTIDRKADVDMIARVNKTKASKDELK